MKKFFKISIAAMAAMLALGGTSCQRDEQTTPPAGDASLRFSFATATQPGFVTRAEIATEFEWKIESIDIYAADTDGNLSLLVKDTDYTIDPDPATDNDATNREFNVTMTDEWIESPDNMGKQFTFYFVGNSTQTGNSQLAAITTEAAMKQALTVGETPDANGQIDLFNEPSATSLFLFTEVVEDVLLSGKQDVTGRLARRVARFDIENPTYDRTNEFVVDEIRVMNATDRGYIFRTAAPDFATDIDPTRADYVPLAGFPTDHTPT